MHYQGTLIDGTVFDSSIQRGEPATFPVNGVIAGWTEALLMMKEGAKYQLVIPPKLAYGVAGPATDRSERRADFRRRVDRYRKTEPVPATAAGGESSRAVDVRFSRVSESKPDVEPQHVDARLTEKSQLPPLGELVDQRPDLRGIEVARLWRRVRPDTAPRPG